jgi:hypothetical protein
MRREGFSWTFVQVGMMTRAALLDIENDLAKQLSARTVFSVVILFHVRSTLI